MYRAYNVNKLMPFQVKRLFDMTEERAKDSLPHSSRKQLSESALEELANRGEHVYHLAVL